MAQSLQDRLAELRATAAQTRDTRESLGLSAVQFQQLQSGTRSGTQTLPTSGAGSVPSPTRPTQSPQFQQPSRTTSGAPSFQAFQPQVEAPRVGPQQTSGDTLADIVRRQTNLERQRAEDTTRDFSNATTFDAFEFDGRTFTVNQQTGRLQDIGAASVQQGPSEDGKVIGVRSDGARFNLGTARGGLGFPTTKETSLQSLGINPRAGASTGDTLRSSDLGNIDFAKNLNLRADPKKGKTETSEQFRIRLLSTRLNNVSQAYNQTMKAFEQQRLRDVLQQQQIVPLSVLRQNKSRSQIKSELEQDREINTQFNMAKDAYKVNRNALAKQNIENRTKFLKGSAASKEVVMAAIKKEEEQKAKDDIAAKHNEFDQTRQEHIDKIADAELQQKNQAIALANKFEGKSEIEVQQMKEQESAQKIAESFLEADPTLSTAQAAQMAKNVIQGKQKAKSPTRAQKIESLNLLFADPSFKENVRGNELAVAASELGTLSAAKDFAKNHLFIPPAEIQRQEFEVLRAENPHLSEQQIFGKQKRMAVNERIERHVSGDEFDEDFLAFLDVNSPETAFRLRRKLEDPSITPNELSQAWKKESKLPRQLKRRAQEEGIDVLDIVQETYPDVSVEEALAGKAGDQSLGLSQSQRQTLAKRVYQQNLSKAAKTPEDVQAAQEMIAEIEEVEQVLSTEEKMGLYKRLDSFLGGFLPGGIKRGEKKIDTLTEEEFLQLSPEEQEAILSEAE